LLWGRSQRGQAAFIFGDVPRGDRLHFSCFGDASKHALGKRQKETGYLFPVGFDLSNLMLDDVPEGDRLSFLYRDFIHVGA